MEVSFLVLLIHTVCLFCINRILSGTRDHSDIITYFPDLHARIISINDESTSHDPSINNLLQVTWIKSFHQYLSHTYTGQ